MPLITNAQSLKPYQTIFHSALRSWAQTFTHFHLSDFIQTGLPQRFDNTNQVKAKSGATFNPIYQKALSTSPDGHNTIDIYSYLLLQKKHGKFTSSGSDVEQNILLGSIPEHKWKRIAYFGYAQRAQEICWINNDTFILAAARLNKANKNRPVIIVGHIKAQSLTTFESTDVNCYQNTSGYSSAKLTALHIQKTH